MTPLLLDTLSYVSAAAAAARDPRTPFSQFECWVTYLAGQVHLLLISAMMSNEVLLWQSIDVCFRVLPPTRDYQRQR
jgi:hypothetical protein